MTKRKDAIALFDLISKGKTERTAGLSVPGWFSKRPAPAPTPGDPGASEPPPSAPEPSPFSPEAPAEPIFSAAGSVVRITLNYATCAMAGLGFILALGIFFWLGRVSARTSANVSTPGGASSGGAFLRTGGTDANAASPVATERIKGKYYLIIERMKGMTDKDELDAEAVVDYCRRNGFPCTLVKLGTQRYAVLSLKPFDSSSSREALDYAKSIEDLGRKYNPPAQRLKYYFSQQKDGRLNPSFHQE